MGKDLRLDLSELVGVDENEMWAWVWIGEDVSEVSGVNMGEGKSFGVCEGMDLGG